MSPINSNDSELSSLLEPFQGPAAIDRLSKVVGGLEALPHEFPYQVQIQYNENFHCGGSILSSIFILTAAHCFKRHESTRSRFKIIAGDHNRFQVEDSEQSRNVSHIFIHEDYDWDTDQNDIALIALDKPLLFNRFVNNITLPPESPVNFYGLGTVTGWGKIGPDSTDPTSDTLQKVSLPIVPKIECRDKFRRVRINVTDSMLCAGERGKDSCQGDSGGPLMCRVENTDRMVQCGIVSHGIGCGNKGYPGIYTDVSHYIRWINHTVTHYKKLGKCSTNSFYCWEDQKCISRSLLCNEIPDCSRGSDETKCLSHTPGPRTHFRCDNGISIKSSWHCDKQDDCGDLSDETKCSKAPCDTSVEFQCLSDGRCIDASWRCDQTQDCDDNSDESACGSYGSENSIPINIPIPTNHSLTNDNKICAPGFFRCPGKYGICIPERWLCDGAPDCRFGEDEINCENTTTTEATRTSTNLTNVSSTSSTSIMPVRDRNVSVTSSPSTYVRPVRLRPRPCGSTEFRCHLSTIVPDNCIPSSFRCDGDKDCLHGEDEDEFICRILSIVTISTTTARPTKPATNTIAQPVMQYEKPCKSGQFQCLGSGYCLSPIFVCDGEKDCSDESDELNCFPAPNIKPNCSQYQWRCQNGDCIYHQFRCDRDLDCVDGSDELGCEISPDVNVNGTNSAPNATTLFDDYSSKCSENQFQCSNGDCIHNRFRCDGDPDCHPDGSDEDGCPTPSRNNYEHFYF